MKDRKKEEWKKGRKRKKEKHKDRRKGKAGWQTDSYPHRLIDRQ